MIGVWLKENKLLISLGAKQKVSNRLKCTQEKNATSITQPRKISCKHWSEPEVINALWLPLLFMYLFPHHLNASTPNTAEEILGRCVRGLESGQITK